MTWYTIINPKNGKEEGEQMLNKNLLKAAIAKAGYTQERLAECIGISPNTLSSRMVGTSHFNTDEIDKICSVLHITHNSEKADIFLACPSQIWEIKKSNDEKGA